MEKIESIEVEYIVADLKGKIEIKFSEFVYANDTIAGEEGLRRRALEVESSSALTLQMEI